MNQNEEFDDFYVEGREAMDYAKLQAEYVETRFPGLMRAMDVYSPNIKGDG